MTSRQDQGQLDGSGWWVLMFIVILFAVNLTLYAPIGTASPDELDEASDVVSNCDGEPGCGMLPLAKIFFGVLGTVVVGSAGYRAWRRWTAPG